MLPMPPRGTLILAVLCYPTPPAPSYARNRIIGRGELISKAIGTQDLRIIEDNEQVQFPWYPKTEDADEINYYLQLTEGS